MGKFFEVIGTALLMMIIITFPFMWVWNAIIPDIFGLPTIGFWQSLGLMFLSNVLRNNSTTTKD